MSHMQLFEYPSYNGRDVIKGALWRPAKPIIATVHIMHGFQSSQAEFGYFTAALAEHGICAYTTDHAGHGRTAEANDTWGHYGKTGWRTFVEDARACLEIRQKAYPDVPHFLYGFSMGTMVARHCAAEFGDQLAGIILEGVVEKMDSLAAHVDDCEFQNIEDEGKEFEPGDALLDDLFQVNMLRYEGLSNSDDWSIISEEAAYARSIDPYRMEPHGVTVAGVAEFIKMYGELLKTEWEDSVPLDLPFYMISGDQDPCGCYGQGVFEVADRLFRTGHKYVLSRVYANCRHQLCNEPEIQDQVIQGIIQFMDLAITDPDQIRRIH